MCDEASWKVVDKHCPLVTRKMRSTEAPWIDAEYRTNRTMRRKLENEWKNCRKQE